MAYATILGEAKCTVVGVLVLLSYMTLKGNGGIYRGLSGAGLLVIPERIVILGRPPVSAVAIRPLSLVPSIPPIPTMSAGAQRAKLLASHASSIKDLC